MAGPRGATGVVVAFIAERDMIHGSLLHGWRGRFFHSEKMTFARWTISAAGGSGEWQRRLLGRGLSELPRQRRVTGTPRPNR